MMNKKQHKIIKFDIMEIVLSPVMPNAIYQVSEDEGETWEDIKIDERGSVQREFEPDRSYHFRVMPKRKRRDRIN
jgi:hypothetical protein